MKKRPMKFMVGGVLLLAISYSYYRHVSSPKREAAARTQQVHTVEVRVSSVEFPK